MRQELRDVLAGREIVSIDEWRRARVAHLEHEKEHTRQRDRLVEERRRLPLVKLDKHYVFDGPHGASTLLGLFEGQRQLIVHHIMFHSERGAACVGCSFQVDNLPSNISHLRAQSTRLVLVSRAPLPELERFKRRMGWTLPWYSSLGSDFNYDFHVTTDAAVTPVEYNYRDQATLEQLGQSYHVRGEQPGLSVFLRDGDDVYHSYSTYGRGLEVGLATLHYLDLTPLGRQGLGVGGGPVEVRYHDEYREA